MIEAILLCGGRGTRLGALTDECPKPMIDVGGRPFLAGLIAWGARAGVTRCILTAGYRGEQIRAHFESTPMDCPVRCVDEPQLLGTGGALWHAAAACAGDPFLVMNGDSFCPLALGAMVARHQATGAAITLAVARVDDVSDYGTVALTPTGEIQAFNEKTASGAAGWVNAGVYIVSRRVLDTPPGPAPFSWERAVLPAWCGRGLHAFVAEGPLYDIGTPARLARARRELPARWA